VKLTDGRLFSNNSVPEEIFDEFAGTNSYDEYYAKKIVPAFSFQRMA